MRRREIRPQRHLSALSKKMRALKYISLAILLCWFSLLYLKQKTEGFKDLRVSYEALQIRLRADLQDYCNLTMYVKKQMKAMYTGVSKQSDKEADTQILQTYKDVYACKDELADSRASCKAGVIVSGDFIPCSTYTRTPDWTYRNEEEIAVALSAIPDDLETRIMVELEYYDLIIEKLEYGISIAQNPPSKPPESSSSPSTDSNGNSWGVRSEGFSGLVSKSKLPRCSPATAQAKIEQQRKQQLMDSASATSCTIPSLESEILRINTILDSSSLKKILSRSKATLKRMLKVLADIEEIKKKWDTSGPKKSYVNFQGGDRVASLLFSMQQVR